nr:hypothetical protein [Klebsiella pneumoniae]
MVQMLVDPFGQFFDGLLLELVTFPELDVQALATWLRFRPIAPSCRHDSRTVFTSSSVRTGIRFNDRSHFCT